VQRGEVDRLHVDREDAVERRLGDLQQRLVGHRVAGVVDQDVEPAEGADRPLDEALHVAVDGHVRLVEFGRAAGGDDLVGDARAAGPVDVVDDEVRALLGETLGDALAEARSGAGDDRDLGLESHVLVSPPMDRRAIGDARRP
jgi:hypothetical protein